MKDWFIRFSDWVYSQKDDDMHLLFAAWMCFSVAVFLLLCYVFIAGARDEQHTLFFASLVCASFGGIALMMLHLDLFFKESPADEDEPSPPTTSE